MIEEKAPYKTAQSEPVGAVPTLEDILTDKQRSELANNLVQVLNVGYGELTIAVRGGRIRFMRVELSHEFSAKE